MTFDSQTPVGTGQAVYVSAVAEEVTGVDRDRGIDVYSRASVAGGAREWSLKDVLPPALRRLYRATMSEPWVLDPASHPVHGRALDYWTPVTVEANCPEP